jgi:hypothetical protein
VRRRADRRRRLGKVRTRKTRPFFVVRRALTSETVIKTVINWQLSCHDFRKFFVAMRLWQMGSRDHPQPALLSTVIAHPVEALSGVI